MRVIIIVINYNKLAMEYIFKMVTKRSDLKGLLVYLPRPVHKAFKDAAKARGTTMQRIARDTLAKNIPAVVSPNVVKPRPVRQLIK